MSIDDLITQDNIAIATRNVDLLALEMIEQQAETNRQITELSDTGQVAYAMERVNSLIERAESHTITMPESIYYLSHTLTLGYLHKMLLLKKKRKEGGLDAAAFTTLLENYLIALDKIIALGPYLPTANEDQRNWTAKVLEKSNKTRTDLLAEIAKRKISLPGSG